MSDPIPFSKLKPGDKVVYYQESFDHYHHAIPGIATIRSNDGEVIILDEIAGWKLRVSDGNPVGFEERPGLCTYIVPTTPALIARVSAAKELVRLCHARKEYVMRVDWHAQGHRDIEKVYEAIRPRCPWTKQPLDSL